MFNVPYVRPYPHTTVHRHRCRCSNSNYLVICINRNVYIFCCINGVIRRIIYTDDLAIIAESKQELQEVLEEWKGVFDNTY